MQTTRYFDEQVLQKRPYLRIEWCVEVVELPLRRIEQNDGRWRHWGTIIDPRDGTTRFLRVVTLADGATLHNAFFDRGFEETET